MGWISDRHMMSGGSINKNCRNNGSHNGPLRKITKIYFFDNDLFGRDIVQFECGHDGHATNGALRGRCKQCKKEQEAI